MTFGCEGRQFRLLTFHFVLWSIAMSLASGFVGAYLLRLGFGIETTILMYALLLAVRFGLRAVMLPVVRRLGMHKAMLLGSFIVALQFLPLIRADEPLWLGAWILVVSTGECIY
jgi:MFS transporter, DHA1 family, inner membrane transport protein